MSKRGNNTDICVWLTAIWSILIIMMLNQCSSQENIDRKLSEIEHEVRMLRYNID